MAKDNGSNDVLAVFESLTEAQRIAVFGSMADTLRTDGLASVVKSAAEKFDSSEHIIGDEVWESPIASLISKVRDSVKFRCHVSGNYNTETGQPQVRVFFETVNKDSLEEAATELGNTLADNNADEATKNAVKALGSRWVATGPISNVLSENPIVIYGEVTPKKLELTGPTVFTQQRKRTAENGEPTITVE